jgi:hypothetical protein
MHYIKFTDQVTSAQLFILMNLSAILPPIFIFVKFETMPNQGLIPWKDHS